MTCQGNRYVLSGGPRCVQPGIRPPREHRSPDLSLRGQTQVSFRAAGEESKGREERTTSLDSSRSFGMTCQGNRYVLSGGPGCVQPGIRPPCERRSPDLSLRKQTWVSFRAAGEESKGRGERTTSLDSSHSFGMTCQGNQYVLSGGPGCVQPGIRPPRKRRSPDLSLRGQTWVSFRAAGEESKGRGERTTSIDSSHSFGMTCQGNRYVLSGGPRCVQRGIRPSRERRSPDLSLRGQTWVSFRAAGEESKGRGECTTSLDSSRSLGMTTQGPQALNDGDYDPW